MSTQPAFVGDLQRALDAAPPYALVPAVVLALEEALGAKEVAVYLADYGAITLERVPAGSHRREVERLEIDWSGAGACFRNQQAVVEATGPAWQVDVPVTVRSDRLGVLRTVLPEEPEETQLRVLGHVGATLAYTIAAARRYTDFFERIRRRRELALAAEIQWELLPVLAYDADEFSLAGTLEPAYEIAGDTLDYAVDAERLTLSIADAVGHGLRAAMTASLVTAALRNARRRGLGIIEQATTASAVLRSQVSDEEFVTAMLVDIDIATGRADVINAGHSLLWRCRDRSVEHLAVPADPPLGLLGSTAVNTWRLDVEPGDRLVLVSDGVLTAVPGTGDPFGEERLIDLLESVLDEDCAEAVRQVAQAVVGDGLIELGDDVTVICVDWSGRPSPPTDAA